MSGGAVSPKRTTLLAGSSVAQVTVAELSENDPTWTFWIIGALTGFGLGGVGPASRATVGLFTPRHKTAEFFGLWAFVYKLAGVVGVLLYGQIKAALGDTTSLIVLFGYFSLGFILLFAVDEKRGAEVARQAEREAGA